MLNKHEDLSVALGALYHVSRLKIAESELLLPQTDVMSIESVYEINHSSELKTAAGSIYRQGSVIDVFCLSPSLDLLQEIPESYTQCVIMSESEGVYALLCQEVRNLELDDIHFEPLPVCMNHSNMPLTHLAVYGESESESQDRLGLVTHSELLKHYIDHLGAVKI